MFGSFSDAHKTEADVSIEIYVLWHIKTWNISNCVKRNDHVGEGSWDYMQAK